jgi:hypothetical protein
VVCGLIYKAANPPGWPLTEFGGSWQYVISVNCPTGKKSVFLRRIVCYERFWETVQFNRTIEGNEHKIAIRIRSQ